MCFWLAPQNQDRQMNNTLYVLTSNDDAVVPASGVRDFARRLATAQPTRHVRCETLWHVLT